MFYATRKVPFILASTDHGSMIVNRFDYSLQKRDDGTDGAIGVGFDLLDRTNYDAEGLELLCQVIEMRHESFGPGVMVIDGGANIGCYTLEIARMMTGWGSVLAFEPQKWIYRALCGNVCLNNLFNAELFHAALGNRNAAALIARIDYCRPHNFGGVGMLDTSGPVDEVAMMTVDSFGLQRLDVLKLDIEGMELEALEGAQETLKRCKPIVFAEHIICGMDALERVLRRLDYDVRMTGMNVLAIHESDPVGKRIRWHDPTEKAA